MQSGAELFPSTVGSPRNSCICMHMHACILTVDGKNSAPLCMSCMPCILRTHAYIQQHMHVPAHAETRDARTESSPDHRWGGAKRPPAPPEAGPLWSGLDFARASLVFACVCIVCMHACGVCMVGMYMHAYACIPCNLRTHAYIQYTRTRLRMQKPETLDQNRAQTTEAPPPGGLGGASCPPSMFWGTEVGNAM